MQTLSKWILKMAGWKLVVKVDEPTKSVICVAPHTSNWDFLVGKLAYWALGRKASFLIKKSWFIFPMGYLFDALGGVPINRTKSSSITEQMAEEFNKRDTFHLAITPEGTRGYVERWKLGFYYIACKAKVPIQIAIIDYSKKEMIIEDVFYPSFDEKTDLMKIQAYYQNAKGRFPHKFNLKLN